MRTVIADFNGNPDDRRKIEVLYRRGFHGPTRAGVVESVLCTYFRNNVALLPENAWDKAQEQGYIFEEDMIVRGNKNEYPLRVGFRGIPAFGIDYAAGYDPQKYEEVISQVISHLLGRTRSRLGGTKSPIHKLI